MRYFGSLWSTAAVSVAPLRAYSLLSSGFAAHGAYFVKRTAYLAALSATHSPASRTLVMGGGADPVRQPLRDKTRFWPRQRNEAKTTAASEKGIEWTHTHRLGGAGEPHLAPHRVWRPYCASSFCHAPAAVRTPNRTDAGGALCGIGAFPLRASPLGLDCFFQQVGLKTDANWGVLPARVERPNETWFNRTVFDGY